MTIEKPMCLESAIGEIEFIINGAKNDYLVNQWICHFLGLVLFELQLWRTNTIGFELKGFEAPNFEECMNAFYSIVEQRLTYHKELIKNRIESAKSD